MLMRIIAGTLAVVAIAAATVGIGTPSPEQDAAWTFLHDLRGDGVEVQRVTCEAGSTPDGGNTVCRVFLPGSTVTVPLYVFEDGSYRFVRSDDRP